MFIPHADPQSAIGLLVGRRVWIYLRLYTYTVQWLLEILAGHSGCSLPQLSLSPSLSLMNLWMIVYWLNSDCTTLCKGVKDSCFPTLLTDDRPLNFRVDLSSEPGHVRSYYQVHDHKYKYMIWQFDIHIFKNIYNTFNTAHDTCDC